MDAMILSITQLSPAATRPRGRMLRRPSTFGSEGAHGI